MKIISIKDKEFRVPSNWNDLSVESLRAISRLSRICSSPAELQLKVLLQILGWRILRRKPVHTYGSDHYWIKPGKRMKPVLVDHNDLAGAITVLDFLFRKDEPEEERLVFTLYPRLTKAPFPCISVGRWPLKKRWVGPGVNLTTITWEEYIRAEVSLADYVSTKNEIHLNYLVACLWRPARKNVDRMAADYKGDDREEYNDFSIDFRAKEAAKISREDKDIALYFFQGCSAFIREFFHDVYYGGAGETISDQNNRVMNMYMMLTDSLSDNDVTKYPAVEKALLWEILFRLRAAKLAAPKKKKKNGDVQV